MTLTIDEIKDLAEFAGFKVGENITGQESDTEITIQECPARGVRDDDNKIWHTKHIAYLEEYPEEGCIPLGRDTHESS